VKIVRPVPPTVSIKVNGQILDLPANPVRSSNANGVTGYDLYEAPYAVPAEAIDIPKVTASSSDGRVKVDVKQADAKNGTAVVKFDFNGVVKTYRVAFTSK
jgi:hypothetical protein